MSVGSVGQRYDIERERIERHASPVALAVMIDTNILKQKELVEEARWLARTLRRRLQQIDRGEWPPKGDDE